jgi:hypothetical protein
VFSSITYQKNLLISFPLDPDPLFFIFFFEETLERWNIKTKTKTKIVFKAMISFRFNQMLTEFLSFYFILYFYQMIPNEIRKSSFEHLPTSWFIKCNETIIWLIAKHIGLLKFKTLRKCKWKPMKTVVLCIDQTECGVTLSCL